MFQLLHLEHDHSLVDGLEKGVGEAGTAVEEAALEDVEQQKLDEGAGGQAVEELLLVETAAVEVALEEDGWQAEGLLPGAVLQNLLGFEGAVVIVAKEPMAETLGEGVMIERVLQIPHGTIHHGDRINQPLVVHELGTEEADVPGRGLHMAKLAALKEVAAANAVGYIKGIGVAGEGLELGSGLGSKTLVGIDHEEPGIVVGNLMDTPGAMDSFIAAIGHR